MDIHSHRVRERLVSRRCAEGIVTRASSKNIVTTYRKGSLLIKGTALFLYPIAERRKPVNGHKMYDIIYMTFLGPDKLTHEELLYRLDISARHYYRLRTQAINIIALRLWSAPAGKVDSWLEVLSILENW